MSSIVFPPLKIYIPKKRKEKKEVTCNDHMITHWKYQCSRPTALIQRSLLRRCLLQK